MQDLKKFLLKAAILHGLTIKTLVEFGLNLIELFYNSALFNMFPSAFVDVLPIFGSDNSPIVFNTTLLIPQFFKPFRFQALVFKCC